ncbi:MAG: phosphopyruvate hydratase [Paramarteilia canceri]
MEVEKVSARSILDSRGFPTVEVCLMAKLNKSNGSELMKFVASVPSGASTGSREACELRDGDKKAFLGKGVNKAVENVNTKIAQLLVKEDKIGVERQFELDEMIEKLDGTKNKTNLGANAILAVSMALCRAGAAKKNVSLYKHINDLANENKKKNGADKEPINMTLPYMFFNVLNGGKHADNDMSCQEIMFTIVKSDGIWNGLQKSSEVFHTLKFLIKKQGQSTNVGDEGGFAPNFSPEQGVELILQAAKSTDTSVKIGFDFAASEFQKDDKYDLDFKLGSRKDPNRVWSSTQLAEYYQKLVKDVPEICSIEDPFSEDDSKAFSDLMKRLKDTTVQVVADDLTVTNPEIIEKSAKNFEANALLVKMNQIGSVGSTLKACQTARNHGWNLMVSHRSGETSDSFAADLSVGVGAKCVKFGAPCRGERVAKYNRLAEIEIESNGQLKMHPEKF